jgi:hypothetical protein
LVFVSGDELETVEKLAVELLEPGDSTDIEITLKAPRNYGSYASIWQIQDIEGNPIGDDLKIIITVGATPTPRTTATPTLTATTEITAPTAPLQMSVPILAECVGTNGRVEWGASGGPSSTYRFFASGVSPENELPGSYNEFDGFPHVLTYFTTSGELTWPVPEDCCLGDFGHYVSPDGYEIVWQKIYLAECQ